MNISALQHKKYPLKSHLKKETSWGESLTFSLVPRILYPNKGHKNDRAKVERYTDYYFGAESFSSFSLGHYCEAYIDWGPTGMMLQLIFYGIAGVLIIGLIKSRYPTINPLLYCGIMWVLLQPWGTFQQDMVTVSGTLFWGSLCHLFIFSPLYRWADQSVTR